MNNCLRCGEEFKVVGASSGKYCSVACYHATAKEKYHPLLVDCKTCGKVFRTYPSKLMTGRGVYCSQACLYNSRHVYKDCEQCGKTFKVFPAELQRGGGKYCSKACFYEGFSGPNHSWWRGGITSEQQAIRNSTVYAEWRTSVFERDAYTCQECGIRGGNLHAHHLFTFAEFPEHQLATWNGTTLCVSCHGARHSTKGQCHETAR